MRKCHRVLGTVLRQVDAAPPSESLSHLVRSVSSSLWSVPPRTSAQKVLALSTLSPCVLAPGTVSDVAVLGKYWRAKLMCWSGRQTSNKRVQLLRNALKKKMNRVTREKTAAQEDHGREGGGGG